MFSKYSRASAVANVMETNRVVFSQALHTFYFTITNALNESILYKEYIIKDKNNYFANDLK